MYLPEYAVTLETLRADHGEAVLAFERENCAYFAASVSDSGDEYLATFGVLHAALLAEQEAGICRFHVLVDESGAVVGRVNLMDLEDGSAELGCRIAEKAAGRGLATAAVRALAGIAVSEYGLIKLTAQTTLDNARSQAVLSRVGFRVVGERTVGGRPGTAYELMLEDGP